MNREESYDYIKKLDWNLDRKIQLKAVEEIKSLCDFDYSLLIQPLGKQLWENSAAILCSIDNKLLDRQIILGLFDWIQDLNWPGADIVFAYLKAQLSNHNIYAVWKDKLQQAIDQQDYDWLTNLKMLMDKTRDEKSTDDGFFC